jgi:predicted DCC family thiol-disulfide oxidoreductase YuxK
MMRPRRPAAGATLGYDGATLVYDGDCAFCTRSAAAIGRLRLAEPRIVAFQHADLTVLGLSRAQCERELQWVRPDGSVDGGAQAVAQLLLASGGLWAVLGALVRLPPGRWLAAGLYRLVADNRRRLPGGTPACALPPAERPGAA